MSELATYIQLGFHHIVDVEALDHILFLRRARGDLPAARRTAGALGHHRVHHWPLGHARVWR